MEASETVTIAPPLDKSVNQKQYCMLEGMAEINPTYKDLKDAGVMIPIISQISWLVKTYRLLRCHC